MNPHDDITRLSEYIADQLADGSLSDGTETDVDYEDSGRILATVDGREYLITITPNTEQPGITRVAYPDPERARILKQAAGHLQRGADAMSGEGDHGRGLQSGMRESAVILANGLAVQPDVDFWTEPTT